MAGSIRAPSSTIPTARHGSMSLAPMVSVPAMMTIGNVLAENVSASQSPPYREQLDMHQYVIPLAEGEHSGGGNEDAMQGSMNNNNSHG
ncbi:uncharacterized protein K460DRAFT_367707 [Cucurbitaria berberidis CBS 394.84]|uniref:Uncharacterized protein n=1 Tax=Cucurbitaria berberidis CBS 394.84 TaxID=1168544 RepID=A0A9P4GBG2_9PLEO|nr:uncharacterized protein K460DRAFT_367707 [Cucurbitaria berberidis CBS 394.84]KAF1842758.1 hypothetical protein K460DRAFT_367707 [Cucurbitaria berberidis CBS 394.84]